MGSKAYHENMGIVIEYKTIIPLSSLWFKLHILVDDISCTRTSASASPNNVKSDTVSR